MFMDKFNTFSFILTIIILIELILGACSIFTMSIVTLYIISFCGWISLLCRNIEDFVK